MISKEAIKRILDNPPITKGVSEWLHECLFKAEAIRQRRNEILSQIREEEEKFKNTAHGLEYTLRILQSDCPHWDQTYHADTAGGSDSHTTCNICGKQW